MKLSTQDRRQLLWSGPCARLLLVGFILVVMQTLGWLDRPLLCLAQESDCALTLPANVTHHIATSSPGKGRTVYVLFYNYRGPNNSLYQGESDAHSVLLSGPTSVCVLRGQPEVSVLAVAWPATINYSLFLALLLGLVGGIEFWKALLRPHRDLRLLNHGVPAPARFGEQHVDSKGNWDLTYEVGEPAPVSFITRGVKVKDRPAYEDPMPAVYIPEEGRASLLRDLRGRPQQQGNTWVLTRPGVPWTLSLGVGLLLWTYLAWWALRAIG